MARTMSFACYCLASETGRTYIGFTTNLDRRLRQHNTELSGGAKATKGQQWKRILSVIGFPSQKAALQFEWMWKHLTRSSRGETAVERRCTALVTLLNLESSTSKAQPFSTYEAPLTVFVEDSSCTFLEDKEMRYGIVIE
jgi:predicted GIY-YIG superfamily endonuclease